MLSVCMGPGHGCPPRPAGTALQEVPCSCSGSGRRGFCQAWDLLSNTQIALFSQKDVKTWLS